MRDGSIQLNILPSDIADLPVPVATLGAIRSSERVGDDVFESTVSLAEIIYELQPR